MKTTRVSFAGLMIMALAAPLAAQDATGVVATDACKNVVIDNVGAGGELYTVKVHNPGAGPDEHTDWLFDLRAKGGARMPGVDAGGSSYSITGDWKHNLTPPEDMFVIITYPNGRLALDSGEVRTGAGFGAVNTQVVGNSLPLGVAAGIGLSLPGNASAYGVSTMADQHGTSASFPFGTARGIEVAFSPLAEVNDSDISPGCTVGSQVEDPQARFGLIVGYNVYRVAGPSTVVPQPRDFMGQWQYYIPYDTFNLTVADPPGQAGADLNGDTLPDGDGGDAPSDSNPDGDLVGLQNPNGIPHDGDEVLLYQDSWFNPDRTPRTSGTGPDLTGNTGYWYAFQPVLYAGPSALTDFDGVAFSRADLFAGQHSMDADGNGLVDSVDLDQDTSPDFYSPQAEAGIGGLGLTNGGFPLLSAPVYGRVSPAVASDGMSLTGRPVATGVELVVRAAFERADVLGYNVRRMGSDSRPLQVNRSLILAAGTEGATYRLTDSFLMRGRRPAGGTLTYVVETVRSNGEPSTISGPFTVGLSSSRLRRR